MFKNFSLFIFVIFLQLSFSQSIYHDNIKEVPSRFPLTIEVLTELNNSNYINYNLFYKIKDQLSFFQQPMILDVDGYYKSIIPANHVVSGNIEYFILLESENGNVISLPENSPDINPYIVKIIDDDYSSQNTIDNINFLNTDITILSPLPFETVLAEDLIISLSYFQLEGLDIETIEIYLDNINITNRATIKKNHLIIVPPYLDSGKHNIKVSMKNNFGVSFEPAIWSFNVISDINELEELNKFSYNGRLWNDYLDNTVDSVNTAYNTFNFNFNGKTEWLDFSMKLKKSSLENDFEQPKDRFLLKLNNKHFKINYGDFYPQLGLYGLSGSRVRGAGLYIDTKFFQMQLIEGELNRSIQGNQNNESIIISEFSDIIDDFGLSDTMLTLSKDNYTFKRDLSGLRLAFGDRNKANFGFNIIKAKDDINSINSNFSYGEIISLEKIIDYYDFNSDQFGDVDSSNDWSLGDSLFLDYNNDNVFTDEKNICNNIDNDLIVTCELDTEVMGSYLVNDANIDIKQKIWNVEVVYTNEIEFKNLLNIIFNDDFSNISINELNNQWIGQKPEDNFVIGSDMNLNFNNLVKVKSGIAFSMQNTNTWNPIKTVDDFDTYADEFEDCYYGRTYINTFPEDYYWDECIAYNPDGTIIMDLIIDDSGIALSDIPNPEDFSDLIHFNFDSVPLIPFYSIIQKQQNDESISFDDVLNSPEVAYNLDFMLTLKKQKVQFGIKQIGASFNSLGNPYLQKDSKKKYFNNMFRFFKNKFFVNFKWESVENGLITGSSNSNTEKYDINLSLYPGINLPSISIGYGIYDKKSGEASSLETIPDSFGDSDLDELSTYDSRLNTETTNINFNLSQNFKINGVSNSLNLSYFNSNKKDILYNVLSNSNPDYISPRSESKSISLNIKSTYDSFWSSNIYFTNNYFNFAQESSLDFYQEQDFSMISLGFSYSDRKYINKISTALEYSSSEGTTNYTQLGIRVSTKFNLFTNLSLIFDFNEKLKILDDEFDTEYRNSIFKANLSYIF